ncbi:MAG: hypothetical protein LBI69_01740 [Puniceicoccales bacterium]|jgi:hypothetical protein|nr:hypothetical protein [Puniceicoccales bacterium]
MNDDYEALACYWTAHPDNAKYVAGELCKYLKITANNLAPYGEEKNAVIFINENNLINLLTLSIRKDGEFLTTCQSCVFGSDDGKRLFGNRQFEMTCNANYCLFNDANFGNAEILKKENGEIAILCDLDGNTNKWLYLGKDAMQDKDIAEYANCISKYFICDDFNIFVADNGFIRNYENGIPKKLLFETKKVSVTGSRHFRQPGKTDNHYLLASNREQDDGCYVAFSENSKNDSAGKPISHIKETSLSRFEDESYIGILHTATGAVKRIFFPRLRDSNGNEISLTLDRVTGWKLTGNENYKLRLGVSQAPLNSNGIPVKKFPMGNNPFVNFSNYLCFENTSSDSEVSYKFFIPGGTYKRDKGLSHDYTFSFPEPKLNGEIFWKSERVGEVSLSFDPIINFERSMTGNTPLGTLRMAQSFQIQGEYEEAIKYLRLLSTNGPIGDDEIAVFSDMIA